MENKVTCVFTSCGRFDMLDITFNTFINTNTYPIEKYIIIDNSTLPTAYESIKKIVKDIPNVDIIVNLENIGQVASIDKAYELVDTEFIFHSEDDWFFFNSGYIEESLDVLLFDKQISNINLRIRFDGERGSMHPIDNTIKYTNNNVIYFEYLQNYLGEWHGFSWNPGLRRKSDYNKIKPYKNYNNEQGVGMVYKNLNFKAACLNLSFCKHIGGNATTPKANM